MTSWQPVSNWYDKIVSKEGHYFHKNVIFPRLLPYLKKANAVLDLACGQGVLARQLPKEVAYTGIDISPSFIKSAKEKNRVRSRSFAVGDVTEPLKVKGSFSHAVCLLALQNISDPLRLFQNAKKHLNDRGELFLVLNHPCFRIPRQTHWGSTRNKRCSFDA